MVGKCLELSRTVVYLVLLAVLGVIAVIAALAVLPKLDAWIVLAVRSMLTVLALLAEMAVRIVISVLATVTVVAVVALLLGLTLVAFWAFISVAEGLIKLSALASQVGSALLDSTKLNFSDRLLLAVQLHLRKFLPEECAAELGALQRRMKEQDYFTRKILLRLLWEFLGILWAIHVHVKIDNLWLSSDRQIDD